VFCRTAQCFDAVCEEIMSGYWLPPAGFTRASQCLRWAIMTDYQYGVRSGGWCGLSHLRCKLMSVPGLEARQSARDE
jgi:hypothetical protein